MRINMIGALASELKIQTFVLVEYLEANGLIMPEEREVATSLIPEALYIKAKEDRSILEALEEIRTETLQQTITYLQRRIEDWELVSFGEEDRRVLEVYYNELTNLEIENNKRERLNQYTEWDSFHWDSDPGEDDEDHQTDNVRNVELEPEDRVEYSIYNSTGYVTFTTSLKEARAMAIQFSGYAVDELGNRI